MSQNLRGAAERLAALAPASQAYSFPERVVVGVDENLNNDAVWVRLHAAVALHHVFMAIALWHELRERSSGERILVPGGHPVGVQHGFDWGRPVGFQSWGDDEVASFALAHLYTYRRVVVLSADRKKSKGGLRGLMMREVGPVLNATRGHGLSLVLLLRLPNTSLDAYGAGVWRFLSAGHYEPGFVEHSL